MKREGSPSRSQARTGRYYQRPGQYCVATDGEEEFGWAEAFPTSFAGKLKLGRTSNCRGRSYNMGVYYQRNLEIKVESSHDFVSALNSWKTIHCAFFFGFYKLIKLSFTNTVVLVSGSYNANFWSRDRRNSLE